MQDMYTVMIVDDEKAIRDSLPVVVFAFVRQREMGRMHSKKYGRSTQMYCFSIFVCQF